MGSLTLELTGATGGIDEAMRNPIRGLRRMLY